ncbi:MAG: diguanylate cyclase [Leptospiraceae bacterium]|nr:diguanylate cyclase [Leptospiraceae bacterium]
MNEIRGREGWRACRDISLSRGYAQDVVWIRATLQNDTGKNTTYYLESTPTWISKVTVYQFGSDGRLEFKRDYGADLPFYDRDFAVPPVYAALTLEGGRKNVIYVRLQSEGSLPVNLVLHSRKSFEKDRTFWSTFNGIILGGVLLLVLYNLGIFWSLRDWDYLVYVIFTLWAAIFLGSVYGYSFQFFWPESPDMHLRITWVAVSLGSATIYLFVRQFLNLKTYMPRTALVFLGLFYVAVLTGILSWPLAHNPLLQKVSNGMGVAATALVLSVSIYGVLRRLPGARVFLAALFFLLLSLMSIGLMNRGLFEFSEGVHRASGVALMMNLSLLSFALAAKIRAIHREKERAESRARKILEASRDDLERRVARRTAELEQARQTAEYLASIDVLTGIKNRRALIDLGRVLLERSSEANTPLSAILMDLDHFKEINDSHGHGVGDTVLEAVGELLTELVEGHDVVGRLGGEEFLIIRANGTEIVAARFAEQVRRQIEMLNIPLERGGLMVTASFGVSEWIEGQSLEELIECADRALYCAKDRGRNRVVQFSEIRE